MRTTFLTVLLLLFLNTSVSAANRYILFDDACMDRLEYAYQNGAESEPYIMYQVNTTPGEKIILEVGVESQTPQDFMPAQFIRCNNAVFDENLVNAINSNIDQVSMVVKKGNRYYISPITYAARYLINDNVILYDSPKYRFQFDRKMGTIGENIAYKNPRAEVFFEGRLENECSGAYLFHQYSEFEGNPHSDIVLVPEVGIVEERSGINAEDALNNTLRLEKVNGRKLKRHLRRVCNGEDYAMPTEPAEEEFTARAAEGEFYTVGQQPNTPAAAPDSYDAAAYTQPRPTAETAPKQLADTKPKSTVHIVKKGETLYRISKQYGVTVDQLKTWNQKTSNTIYPKEQLQVAPPAAPANKQLAAKGGSPGSQPQAYSNYSLARPANAATADKFHIVRPGETVAALALRYGYTESKFREINNLSPNQMVKVGQQVRITHCDCPEDRIQQQYNSAQQPATPSNYSYMRSKGEEAGPRPDAYNNTRQANPPASSNGESFSEEQFGQEQSSDEYRNTPYFLNRPSVSNPPAAYSNQQPSTYTGPTAYDAPGLQEKGYRQPSAYNSPPPQQRVRKVYIVKEGDSLFNIARTHGTTVERLREINNLERNEILIPYQRIYLN